ncbi:MAG TPA: hypothetical protein VEU47_00950 [Candidatus Cybelea sp.]|nr:hypothetical protein [Candidatus Cybelea sp.]
MEALHRRYAVALLVAVLAPVFAWFVIAITIDPYDVFGISHFNRRNFEPNTRYLKSEYLRQHPKFDGYIFGSSRSNGYNVETARRLAGGTFYNFGVSAETMAGIESRLAFVFARGRPRILIVALDYDYEFRDARTYDDLLRTEPPAVTGRSRAEFYGKYLGFSLKSVRRAIRANLQEPDTYYSFDVTTGQISNPALDRDLAAAAPERARLFVPQPGVATVVGADSPAYDSLRRVVAAVTSHGSRLICLVNPLNHYQLASFQRENYLDWLRRTTSICGELWDFSRPGPVTANDANYYDTSHFVRRIGDQVLERVFAAPGAEEHFGARLTPATTDAYIRAYPPFGAEPARAKTAS